MYGGSPGRTGEADVVEGVNNTVALRIPFQAPWTVLDQPVIHGANVYVLLASGPRPLEDSRAQILRINVETGVADTLYEQNSSAYSLASDGTSLYLVGNGFAVAMDPEGRERWNVTFMSDRYEFACTYPSLDGPRLVVACAKQTQLVYDQEVSAFVINTATGAVERQAVLDDDYLDPLHLMREGDPAVVGPLFRVVLEENVRKGTAFTRVAGLATRGEVGVVTFHETAVPDGTGRPSGPASVWAFNLSSGETYWVDSYTGYDHLDQGHGVQFHMPSTPMIVGDEIFVEFERFKRIPISGPTPTTEEFQFRTGIGRDPGSPMAYRNGILMLTDAHHLIAVEASAGKFSEAWRVPAPEGYFWSPASVIVTRQHVYSLVYDLGNESVVLKHELRSGEELWRYRISGSAIFSVAGNFAAVLNAHAELTVLGETAASIKPSYRVDLSPSDAGTNVRLDFSGSLPGAQGPPDQVCIEIPRLHPFQCYQSLVVGVVLPRESLQPLFFQLRNAAGQSTGGYIALEPPNRETSANISEGFWPDLWYWPTFSVAVITAFITWKMLRARADKAVQVEFFLEETLEARPTRRPPASPQNVIDQTSELNRR